MPDVSRSLAQKLIEGAWNGSVVLDGADPLGMGSSGVVWPVREGDEAQAVKVIPVHAESTVEDGTWISASSALDREWKRVRDEADRLSSLWIVGIQDWKLVELQATEDAATAYGLVRMERWPWNLHGYVTRGSQIRTTSQTMDLVRLLAEMLHRIWQEKGFLFTDMKPLNFLVRELADGSQRVVVGDIGGLHGLTSFTGGAQTTPAWQAPECSLMNERIDLVSTIYSFGMVAFFIVEKRLPFANVDVRERFALLREHGPDFQAGLPQGGERILATIKSCLSHDRSKRPQTFVDVLDRLSQASSTTETRPKVQQSTRQSDAGPGDKAATDRDSLGRAESVRPSANRTTTGASETAAWFRPRRGVLTWGAAFAVAALAAIWHFSGGSLLPWQGGSTLPPPVVSPSPGIPMAAIQQPAATAPVVPSSIVAPPTAASPPAIPPAEPSHAQTPPATSPPASPPAAAAPPEKPQESTPTTVAPSPSVVTPSPATPPAAATRGLTPTVKPPPSLPPVITSPPAVVPPATQTVIVPPAPPAGRFDGIWRARIDCKNSRTWYSFSNWPIRNNRLEAIGNNPSSQASWELRGNISEDGKSEITGGVTFRDGEPARLWLTVTIVGSEMQGWGTLGGRSDCVLTGSRQSR